MLQGQNQRFQKGEKNASEYNYSSESNLHALRSQHSLQKAGQNSVSR